MSDKIDACHIFQKKIKPEMVETTLIYYSEKILIVSVTSEKIQYFFTVDTITLIFVYSIHALNSLLRIK